MKEPKDFEALKSPSIVQDVLAEARIKWGVITQGLILIVVTSAFGLGSYFGDRLIHGVDKMHDTLIEVRDEISSLNTGVKVNSTRLDSDNDRINENKAAIRDNRNAIQTYMSNNP